MFLDFDKRVFNQSKILFQTGDINIFVFRSVLFSRYVQLKTSFFDKKISAVKSETHYSKEAIENKRSKVLKENSIIGRSWRSSKLFMVQNYTENANGYVPLTAENVSFLVSLSSRCTHVLSL